MPQFGLLSFCPLMFRNSVENNQIFVETYGIIDDSNKSHNEMKPMLTSIWKYIPNIARAQWTDSNVISLDGQEYEFHRSDTVDDRKNSQLPLFYASGYIQIMNSGKIYAWIYEQRALLDRRC